jgi:molybdopterin/thiamine biosynthesis adenylyltransferase
MDIDAALPMVKPGRPVFGAPGLVQIGGYGSVTEIKDGTGQIRSLLDLLDGSRTVEQVWATLSREHPALSLADVRAAVLQFDDAGFLLDGKHTAAGVLDDYELRRWERNINFFGSYASMRQNKHELQARLRDCRITLIGLGGLGSNLLLNLAAMGVGQVRAVETDRVELSNLNRQFLYRDADVGREKLALAVERVREFNPRIDIEPVSLRIGATEDVLAVAEGADFLISVADRPKTEIMHWVNAGCVQAGVPFVSGGLDTQRAIYYTIVPGSTGCVECWRLTLENDATSVALHRQRRDREIGGDNAAFAPLIMLATGFMLGELTRVVTGIAKPVAAGRLMQVRFDELVEAERWERRPDCPVCGGQGPGAAESPLAGMTAS